MLTAWLSGWMVATAATTLVAADQQRPLQICLDLVNRASLSLRSVNVLRHEVSQIWRRSEHSVVWQRDGVHCDSLGAPLSVVIMSSSERPLPDSVLATIQFASGLPLNEIHAYTDRTFALLEREFRKGGPPFFVAGRDDLMGRVLGRSIAHEVGHYLLSSPTHAPRGLMKKWHSATDLMRGSHTPFILDAVSSEALLSRAQ